jgi:uncharacterized Fe-S center protein
MNNVYFTKDPNQAEKLFDAAGFGNIIKEEDFVALKIHFGERGNAAYLKPERTKPIVKKVKEHGGKPFWIEANTLYKGTRSDTLSHLQTAYDHGYTLGKTGAHILIADGLEGKAYTRLNVNYKNLKHLFIAPLVLEADALISIAHFKGHEVTGFGGTLKNIGMGLGSRAGKQQMHSDIKPQVNESNCTGCGRCLNWCPENAISWKNENKAHINPEKCIGCAECVATCRSRAIAVSWAGGYNSVQEKIVEYTAGILQHFNGKCAFFNFLTDISPNCDCYGYNDLPIAPDIGILASFDPVAIDQAGADLVNSTPGRIDAPDKLKAIWPEVNWEHQLNYAESLGLGRRKYTLVNL